MVWLLMWIASLCAGLAPRVQLRALPAAPLDTMPPTALPLPVVRHCALCFAPIHAPPYPRQRS
ncbi:hypothetical protein GCM10027019_04510 [Melaminivora jejuensis]